MTVFIASACIMILELVAQRIIELCGSKSEIVFRTLPPDDPKVRRADTTLAQRELGWSPQVSVAEGLRRTRDYFVEALAREAQGGT